MTPHNWVPSKLGHGVAMCTVCKITMAECVAIGDLNDCTLPTENPYLPKAFKERLEKKEDD